jgi:hypothetical protein
MAHAEGTSDLARSVSLYRNFAATSLAVVGLFYMFSGLICIGAMRRARRRQEMERLAMIRDLQVPRFPLISHPPANPRHLLQRQCR